jgi:hypothetical protein
LKAGRDVKPWLCHPCCHKKTKRSAPFSLISFVSPESASTIAADRQTQTKRPRRQLLRAPVDCGHVNLIRTPMIRNTAKQTSNRFAVQHDLSNRMLSANASH